MGRTPGVEERGTYRWSGLRSAPQPDAFLRILPSHGGQSGSKGPLGAGAPELAVEICLTSTEVDFGPKLALYQRAGVREYITVERFGELGPEGRHVKPQSQDGAKMLAASNAGLASEDHQRFVERLAAARTQVHGIE
ncbi:MAG TPA: Uma2 family endonuclease [Bryobacteraceae bacterium]|nr:Uma2 family endonuclease [Bryobacteraceae bacterium]